MKEIQEVAPSSWLSKHQGLKIGKTTPRRLVRYLREVEVIHIGECPMLGLTLIHKRNSQNLIFVCSLSS